MKPTLLFWNIWKPARTRLRMTFVSVCSALISWSRSCAQYTSDRPFPRAMHASAGTLPIFTTSVKMHSSQFTQIKYLPNNLWNWEALENMKSWIMRVVHKTPMPLEVLCIGMYWVYPYLGWLKRTPRWLFNGMLYYWSGPPCLKCIFSLQFWAKLMELIWRLRSDFVQQWWVHVPAPPNLAHVHVLLQSTIRNALQILLVLKKQLHIWEPIWCHMNGAMLPLFYQSWRIENQINHISNAYPCLNMPRDCGKEWNRMK